VSPLVKQMLLAELARRGYRDSATSPHGSIVFDLGELGELDLGEFLDLMVTRREKISRAVDTLGKQKAHQHFDDAERAIEAVKTVIRKLTD
jgi:hypothetical protein